MAAEPLRVVRAGERDTPAAAQNAGMTREEAFSSEGRWAGVVRIDGGAASGWHHHADNDSYVYVLSGRVRFEFGPGGRESLVAGLGDFVHVPPRSVHRELNPGDAAESVVMRAGAGPATVNVDGPDA